ncbi:MAG: S9 family peptidase [Acidobacteriota bacterium]
MITRSPDHRPRVFWLLLSSALLALASMATAADNRSDRFPETAMKSNASAVSTVSAPTPAATARTTPPVAAREPHTVDLHGVTLEDPYHWLRDKARPDVIAYLEAENAYADAHMAPTEALQTRLYDELVARVQEDDRSVPVRRDDWLYYTRTEQGDQYPIHCRRPVDAAPDDADAEEILIDVNALAEGHDYFRMARVVASPDHRFLAYAYDTVGTEDYVIQVRDLSRDRLLPDRIEGASTSLVWGNDNRTLFYNVRDDARRPYKVMRHVLGQSGREVEIYREDDQRFFVSISLTSSRRFILITSGSSITSEVRYLDADTPRGDFVRFAPRVQGVEYSVAHSGDAFYVLTNHDATNFRLQRTPVPPAGASPAAADTWENVVDHRPQVLLRRAVLFADHLVTAEREAGLDQIVLRHLDGRVRHVLRFPESVYAVSPTRTQDFDRSVLRYNYGSPVTPSSVYDVDLDALIEARADGANPDAADGVAVLRKRQPVPHYDPANYHTERIYVRAADGVAVPVTLTWRRGAVARDGSAPCLLYGYGSYGSTQSPRLWRTMLPLIDRGFVHAVAHVRGGGLLGEPWHEDGRMLRKRNTFTDFIAVAEHLVQQRYTSSDRLVIRGGSAGGLLVGAVVNMRPALFAGAVASVPFVDVINTMLDPTIPLTVIEYEEWGNPRDPDYFDYIRSYSPYDNVAAQGYPTMLVKAGLHDTRVHYWEPAKWVARLRVRKTDDRPLLLRTNMGAGHSGASGRYDALREVAYELAFILRAGGAADASSAFTPPSTGRDG